MLELFLPWFLTTCISGIFGNRADAKFVSITQKISKQVQVGKLVNHDMQKALNRSFLLALISICNGCLGELKCESHLKKGDFILSGQLRWLEKKELSLEDELKAVEKAEYREPTIELLDEIKLLLIQGNPTSEAFQKIKAELIERAEIGNNKAPECYKESVEENILRQMCTFFSHEIERNQAIRNILETQLLIQQGIKIDTVLDFVPSMIQNLNYIPAMDKKLDYICEVVQEMPQMLERTGSEKNSNASCRSFQVPPLTEDFVEIPKKEEIKNYLLNNNSRGMLAITAIHGLGGIGKTTLVTILGHDKDVQNHFLDGILWAQLGQEPDKLSWLNNWIQALGDYRSIHTTIETASIHLRSLLYEKSILLVIDDAWDSSDVKPFLVGGSNCKTIITTRKAYIADVLGAEPYPLNLMTEKQSLDLFENVLKTSLDDDEKEDALKVAKDVGYLPLALNLAAKRRKKDYSWAKLHDALKEEIARLDVLETPRIFGRGEEGLEASLNLSLKSLRSCNEEVYKDFIWLGVLPEDVKMNERMISTLWDIDKEEAGYMLEGLWGEGLLIQDSTIQLGNEKLKTYRMHDLFHDIALYYLTLSPITKKTTPLPGLGLKLNGAHDSLLNHYQLKTKKKGLWHTLIDDAYIHSHLTWHMEKAGKIEDIHTLLCEENENGKNGWYEALESLGLNAVFIEDIIRAWNLSEKESIHQLEQGNKSSYIGLEIRYALIYASLNSLSANIPEELLVALLETKKWTEDKVLIYAQKEPDLQTRAYKLISIYQETKDESLKKEKLMEKAFDAAFKIETDTEMAEVLLAIFQYSDGQKKEEVMEKALAATSKIRDNNDRKWALSNMISSVVFSNLSEQGKEMLMEKALNAILKLEDNYARARALTDIISYLDEQRREEMLEKAIDATSKIEDNDDKARVISAIIPFLDGQRKEEMLGKALDSASKIENGDFRSGILIDILPYLDEQRKKELIEKVLDLASEIKDNDNRARALSSILSHLDGQRKEEVLEKALNAIFELENDYYRAKALTDIVSNLDGQREDKLIKKVIDAASKIENDYKRAEALSAILPHLDGQRKEEVLEKALNAIFELENDYYRAEALSAIASNLDEQKKEEVMGKALDATSKIEDNYKRASLLSGIVSKLDGQRKEEVLEKVIDAAPKIRDDRDRAKVLLVIVPYLDGEKKEEVMDKALDATSKIEDENERTEALSAIVSKLDGQRKEEVIGKALYTAFKIKDDYKRAKALIAIVPNLDGQRKKELIEKILDTAFLIETDYKRTDALLAIVPNLDGQREKELIEKVLDVASKIKDNDNRARALSSIIPFLDGQRKEEMLGKALDAASKIENGYFRSRVLIDILPYLDGQRKENVLKKALDIASKISDDNDREIALLSILPYLNGQRKEEVLEKALEADSKINYEDDNIRALSEILPYLDVQRKKELIEKDLEATSKIKYDNEIVWALLDILPYLDGQRKKEAMEKALGAVSKMIFDDDRARALRVMLSYLRNLPINNLYFWWRKAIKILRERTRSSLLIDITTLIPVISDLGNDETLFEISRAIIDVSRWWP
jgi:hypothetical protein